jgi:hypothetical protein
MFKPGMLVGIQNSSRLSGATHGKVRAVVDLGDDSDKRPKRLKEYEPNGHRGLTVYVRSGKKSMVYSGADLQKLVVLEGCQDKNVLRQFGVDTASQVSLPGGFTLKSAVEGNVLSLSPDGLTILVNGSPVATLTAQPAGYTERPAATPFNPGDPSDEEDDDDDR